MAPPLKVIALSGSLRAGSYNTSALRAAQALAPEGMTIEIASIADIPFYDADVQAQGIPASVAALGDKIRAADAVLIASPEYNYSVPGVLKNAIDWLSRLPDQPFAGKTVGLIGASMSLLGAVRAQYHLRQIFVFLDALPINKPEVFIAQAHQKFDAEGRLTDEMTRGFIGQLLVSLAAWTRRLKAAEGV
ncbi:MAG TPA: NADPH-dependent FMN reductase [Caulobacteraceae bacterium]